MSSYFLEVAEDYSIAAENALEAVQVKDTKSRITSVSKGVLDSIDSFVKLCDDNPNHLVKLRYLTTCSIGKKKRKKDRLGNVPTLETWRQCARAGDVSGLRSILLATSLSARTKEYIRELNDEGFRSKFLQRIHFDCGAPEFKYLERILKARLLERLKAYGGVPSQLDACLNDVVVSLLRTAVSAQERFVDRLLLEETVGRATQLVINKAQFEEQTRLTTDVIATAASRGVALDRVQSSLPRSIEEVPLPRALAKRREVIDD